MDDITGATCSKTTQPPPAKGKMAGEQRSPSGHAASSDNGISRMRAALCYNAPSEMRIKLQVLPLGKTNLQSSN